MIQERSIQKTESRSVGQPERTHTRPTAVPFCDIYETEDGLTILADLPGVDEKHMNVDLDKDVLTIKGEVSVQDHSGDELTYSDHRPADFQRSFRLSDGIDSEKIEASLKNGVLELYLPKVAAAKPRKIQVNAG
jgi:HSP20 family molecular chaperone IbpA